MFNSFFTHEDTPNIFKMTDNETTNVQTLNLTLPVDTSLNVSDSAYYLANYVHKGHGIAHINAAR